MTVISVGVGSAMAAIDGPLFWPLFLLATAGAVLLHAATNLINDYYDVKNGLDTVASATAQYRCHPLVENLLPAEQVRWAASTILVTTLPRRDPTGSVASRLWRRRSAATSSTR